MLKINPNSLIPPRTLTGEYFPDKETFLFLGSENLRACQEYWQEKQSENIYEINVVRNRIEELHGKTVEDIKAIAREYDNPELGIIVTPREWTSDAKPQDRDSKRRKPDTTTFNLCGWCKYGQQSYYRGGSYNSFHFSVSCSLAPDVINEYNDTLAYDSPCILANGDQAWLETCRQHLTTKYNGLQKKAEVIARKLAFIKDAIKLAEKKPLIPELRPRDWFKPGDKVVHLTIFGTLINNEVTEIEGLSSRATTVKLRQRWGEFDYKDPVIMHEWEHEYFKNHPDYVEFYVKVSDHRGKYAGPRLAKAYAGKKWPK